MARGARWKWQKQQTRILAAVEPDCKGSKPTFATSGLISAHKKRPARCGKPRRPSDGETDIGGKSSFRQTASSAANLLRPAGGRLIAVRHSLFYRCDRRAHHVPNSLSQSTHPPLLAVSIPVFFPIMGINGDVDFDPPPEAARDVFVRLSVVDCISCSRFCGVTNCHASTCVPKGVR